MNRNDETRQGQTGGSQKKLAAGEAAAIVAQRPQARYADPLTHGTYGLSSWELRAEARRLLFERGWQLWEVAARLSLPERGQR
ncbi:hypothetical protein NI25_22650 [Streptomyces sp. CCM_MD2014]|nr:hypothetical protein NI25_22650 [Streptomyces sp. CCM_MD2014]